MQFSLMACAMALIKISLPARDNIFSFHPCIFYHIRSLRNPNAFVLDLPMNTGNSRYLSFAVSLGIFSASITSCLLSKSRIGAKHYCCFVFVDYPPLNIVHTPSIYLRVLSVCLKHY
jgi:hypothetical protein